MKTSDQINEIAKALAKSQGEMKPCPKNGLSKFRDKKGNEIKFEYSTIDDVLSYSIECLSRNEICVLQNVTTQERGVLIETRLIHSSGQWISFDPLCMYSSGQDPHSIASAITYGRRYSLCSAIGIAGEKDDDGIAAMNGKEDKKPEEVKQEVKEEESRPLMDIELASLAVLEMEMEDQVGFEEKNKEFLRKLREYFKVEDLKKLNNKQFVKASERIRKQLYDNAKNS